MPTCKVCGGALEATVRIDLTLTEDGWTVDPGGPAHDVDVYCTNDCAEWAVGVAQDDLILLDDTAKAFVADHWRD